MYLGDKIALMVILSVVFLMFGLLIKDVSVTGLAVKDLVTGNREVNVDTPKQDMYSFTLILLMISAILTIVSYFVYDRLS